MFIDQNNGIIYNKDKYLPVHSVEVRCNTFGNWTDLYMNDRNVTLFNSSNYDVCLFLCSCLQYNSGDNKIEIWCKMLFNIWVWRLFPAVVIINVFTY